jgi:hypothetical protein
MNTRIVRVFALIAAVGVAACGDDDPVSTGDALTETEVAALSSVVLGTAFSATASGLAGVTPAAVDGPQPAPFSYTGSIETTVPCALGGTVELDGSATVNGDDETEEFMVAYNLTQLFSQCGALAEETDQEFTISGSLGLTATADFALGTSQAGLSLSTDTQVSGTIDWSTDDGRSGRCAITLSSEATSNGDSISATTTGSVCGTSVSETFTYGIG